MTRIKLCGLSRTEDIDAANRLMPDYIGFVFWKKSRRFVERSQAEQLRKMLDPNIKAVGVFVDEDPDIVSSLLSDGIIDMAQLHGNEDELYIKNLRKNTGRQVIRAFIANDEKYLQKAACCSADHILFDAGMGDGKTFDLSGLKGFDRPYFLAGGLDCQNITEAIHTLHPFAVDVSSGIETGGLKDPLKMEAFVNAVRSADINE